MAKDALVAGHVVEVLHILLLIALRRRWTFRPSAGQICSLGPTELSISWKYVGAKDSPEHTGVDLHGRVAASDEVGPETIRILLRKAELCEEVVNLRATHRVISAMVEVVLGLRNIPEALGCLASYNVAECLEIEREAFLRRLSCFLQQRLPTMCESTRSHPSWSCRSAKSWCLRLPRWRGRPRWIPHDTAGVSSCIRAGCRYVAADLRNQSFKLEQMPVPRLHLASTAPGLAKVSRPSARQQP